VSAGGKNQFQHIDTAEQLVALVDYLRGEQGCPWDRRQTSQSLKPYLLEELYELLGRYRGLRQRSVGRRAGDVLLHLCFQVSLAREAGQFDLADVIAGIRIR